MEDSKEIPKTEGKPEAEAKKEQPKPATAAKAKPATASSVKIAVILLRNITGASGAIRDTLKMLRLSRKFTCVVIDNRPEYQGMLKKIKDYVTYGEIDDATLKELTEKRGIKDEEGKVKLHFHLHPPKGGFERKGIKHAFAQGGALGYRREKINLLIKKML